MKEYPAVSPDIPQGEVERGTGFSRELSRTGNSSRNVSQHLCDDRRIDVEIKNQSEIFSKVSMSFVIQDK
jgi:hypothetical protein